MNVLSKEITFTLEYEYQETDEEYKQLQRLIAKLRRK